jgi:hypothetical protein
MLVLSLHLRVLAPAKINEEAPIVVELGEQKLERKDAKSFTPTNAEWELRLKLQKPGKQRLLGSVTFYLCADRGCKKTRAEFKEEIEVMSP